MTTWAPPPESLALGAGVHVWRASLDLPDPGELAATLSKEERERASRFKFEKDCAHYIAGRGLLRRLLGRYLGDDPARLEFSTSDHDKPFLTPRSPLRFNLSHSNGLALFAFTLDVEIGVDLEWIRHDLDFGDLARLNFSAEENRVLDTLPVALRTEAFYTCWTRKEALIKARGDGLSLALDSFDVTLAPGEPARLLETRFAPGEAARWTLKELDPGPGFAGALAVEGPLDALACWQWPSE